jgi:hypothetical protein
MYVFCFRLQKKLVVAIVIGKIMPHTIATVDVWDTIEQSTTNHDIDRNKVFDYLCKD